MSYAFINCTIIEGPADKQPVPDAAVVVNSTSGLIEKAGSVSGITIPSGYEKIDLGGRFVMPGLINAHAHLIASGKPSLGDNKSTRFLLKFLKTGVGKKLALKLIRGNVENALNAGVTTIRSMGDPYGYDISARELVSSGKTAGPRLLVSGRLICATGGHGDLLTPIVIDSPWEGRRAVRTNAGMLVDHIKLISTGGVTDSRKIGEAGQVQMTIEEIAAVCDEAHRRKLTVGCHAESTEGVREALLGGVDTIEHGADFDDEIISLFLNNPNSLHGYSSYIPTLSAPDNILKNSGQIVNWDEVKQKNAELVFAGQKCGVNKAFTAGIKTGCGTDSGVPFVTHYNVWEELTLLINHGGITAAEAIETATIRTAGILGIDEFTGSITEGKSADMIVLSDNPLEKIETLASPYMVSAGKQLLRNPKVKKLKI